MRWVKSDYEAKLGEQRTVRLFLWWPRRIGSDSRWLEHADILQEAVWDRRTVTWVFRWVNVAWLDLELQTKGEG